MEESGGEKSNLNDKAGGWEGAGGFERFRVVGLRGVSCFLVRVFLCRLGLLDFIGGIL